MDFHVAAHKKQAEHMERDLADESRAALNQTWFQKDNANYWRHERMYEAVDVLSADPEAKWLTVGDGRFGLDAIRIAEKGIRDVLATDITEAPLRKSREEGRIVQYSVENAEALGFEDEAVDYTFCKESYHHFPRPALALYEMLRVARRGVVLIEPNDPSRVLLRRMKHALKTVLKGPSHPDTGYYEPSGNYVYSISRREMEKVGLGMNLPLFVVKGLNDYYIEGCEFQPASWSNPVYRQIRIKCAMKDALSRTPLYDYNMLMVVLFKRLPLDSTVAQFKARGWSVVRLPENPYL